MAGVTEGRRNGDQTAQGGPLATSREKAAREALSGKCACPGCLTGGICLNRYGGVIPHESAVQAPDVRLRVLAYALASAAGVLRAPHSAVAAMGPAGLAGTLVALRPPPDAEARRSAYLDAFAATDLFAPARFRCGDRAVVATGDVGGPERLSRTACGALLATAGIKQVGAIYLRRNGRIVASIAVIREVGALELSPEELLAAHRLHPLIELSYTLALQHTRPPSTEQLFDRARLTERERDVARLAAQGASNPEIATDLHLTVGTVKIHLHNAYVKLGMRSRSELAARLRAIAPVGVGEIAS
jgi:DNA-binding CsgD family transcriptional regulator